METEKKEENTLSKPIRFFWGIGNGIMVLSTNMSSYFQTIWLTDIAMFAPAAIALMSSISTILNLITAPLIGAILDTTKPISTKWGRYRSWLIIGSIFAVFTAPLTWIRFSDNESVAVIIRIAVMLIATIPMTCRSQSEQALLTVIAKTPGQKSELAARRYMFSNIFRLVSNIIVTAVLAWFLARGLSEGSAYIIMAIAFALLAFGGFYAQFAMTKGYDGEGSELDSRATKKGKKGVSLIDVFKNLFTNPQLLFLFIANTCTSCVSYILTTLAVYYWKYVAENFAMMGTYSLIVNGLGIIGTIAVGECSKKFDNIKLSRIALTGMLVTIALVRPLGLHNQWLYLAILAAHQFFASFNYPIFLAGYANCTVYAEWKNGTSTAAAIMGISGFPLRLAFMITSWIITPTLQKVGYVAGEQCGPATKAGIVGIYSTWGPAFIAVALVIMLFFYKLNNTRMNEIHDELKARKATIEG